MKHFFPKIQVDNLRSDAHQSQIIGGDADVDHTQTIGDTVKSFGGIYPPGFRHPWLSVKKNRLRRGYQKARSQKSAMGGVVRGVWGQSPLQSKILSFFFGKSNLIFGLFW